MSINPYKQKKKKNIQKKRGARNSNPKFYYALDPHAPHNMNRAQHQNPSLQVQRHTTQGSSIVSISVSHSRHEMSQPAGVKAPSQFLQPPPMYPPINRHHEATDNLEMQQSTKLQMVQQHVSQDISMLMPGTHSNKVKSNNSENKHTPKNKNTNKNTVSDNNKNKVNPKNSNNNNNKVNRKNSNNNNNKVNPKNSNNNHVNPKNNNNNKKVNPKNSNNNNKVNPKNSNNNNSQVNQQNINNNNKVNQKNTNNNSKDKPSTKQQTAVDVLLDVNRRTDYSSSRLTEHKTDILKDLSMDANRRTDVSSAVGTPGGDLILDESDDELDNIAPVTSFNNFNKRLRILICGTDSRQGMNNLLTDYFTKVTAAKRKQNKGYWLTPSEAMLICDSEMFLIQQMNLNNVNRSLILCNFGDFWCFLFIFVVFVDFDVCGDREHAAVKFLARQSVKDVRLKKRIVEKSLCLAHDEILTFFGEVAKQVHRLCASAVTKMKYYGFDDSDGSIHGRFSKNRVTIKVHSGQDEGKSPVIAFKYIFREVWPADWDIWNQRVGTATLTSMKASLPGDWLSAFDQKCVNDYLQDFLEIHGSDAASQDNKYTLKFLLPYLICKCLLLLHAIKTNFAVKVQQIRESLDTNASWSPEHLLQVFMFCVCWWPELNDMIFAGLTKWIDSRCLKMYDVLSERLLSLTWCVYHMDGNIKRWQSKQSLFKSVIDVQYYGIASRINQLTLPPFFNVTSADIDAGMWNSDLQPHHLTSKNNHYAIVLWQGLKSHVSPFVKSHFGSGSVQGTPGLSHFDVKHKTIADLIDKYDKTWQTHKKFASVESVVNHLLNSALNFTPRLRFGLSKFVKEKIEDQGLYLCLIILQVFPILGTPKPGVQL